MGGAMGAVPGSRLPGRHPPRCPDGRAEAPDRALRNPGVQARKDFQPAVPSIAFTVPGRSPARPTWETIPAARAFDRAPTTSLGLVGTVTFD